MTMLLSLSALLPQATFAQNASDLQSATLPANAVWVESLNLNRMTSGYKTPQAGKSIDGNPLTLSGLIYPHGVGTHANSEFRVPLRGNATRFAAMVGVDDEVKTGPASITFSVLVDGKTAAQTGVMHGGDKPQLLSVDLTGAQSLILRVGDGGDGGSNDHADWGGALILLAQGKELSALSQPMRDVPLGDPNLRFIGRWDKSEPGHYHSHWGGAYLRTNFSGASVAVKLAQSTSLVVSIDGEPPRAVNAAQGITFLDSAAQPLSPGTHSLLLGSAGQNSELLLQGLQLDVGAKTLPSPPRPIIEFIGDSITAFGGPDGVPIANYAWQSAEALGADHTQIAFSGVALTSGFGCLPDKTGQDVQSFRLKNFNHLDDKTPWNSSYQPAMVVINLGQNDQCGSEPNETLTASYLSFLRALRAKLPRTQIVALRPFGGPYADAIRKAVETFGANGDKKVGFVDTSGWLEKDDYLDGVHPTLPSNVKVARLLAPILKTMLPSAPTATRTAMKTAAGTAIVGDPAHPVSLAQDVQNAYNAGARKITIRPGTYALPNLGRSVFALDGWQNATISARGVTLVLSDLTWNHNLFEMRNCSGVTLEGPTLTQTEITSYQGRVVAVGKDAAGKDYADWRPDAGYPVPPADATKFPSAVNVVDSQTRLLKIGTGDFYDAPMEALGDGTFRIGVGGNFGVGDWLVGRYGNAPFKVFLSGSRDCTIQNVTLQRNGFAPIREEDGGGNHILGVKWALGPRPTGATEDPLISGAADGLHSTGANPGPHIENCSFEGVILDDCIAIHGYFQKIKAVAGNTLTVENGGAGLKVGEPARISNEKGFFGEATVSSLKDNGDNTTTISLDKDLGVPADAKMSNPLRNGAGFKIIGNHLGNTRSRGILTKGDNGLFQNNVIEGCGMAAISIGPEDYWGEADYSHHIVVDGNTFRGNGKAGFGGGAVLVHGDGAIGNSDITVKNNRFESNYGGDVDVQWTAGLAIVGNTFTSPLAWPHNFQPKPPVFVGNAQNIQIKSGQFKTPGVYAQPFVGVGDYVSQLTQDK